MARTTRISPEELYCKTFDQRPFVIKLGATYYRPDYTEPLIACNGDIVIYVGTHHNRAKIGRVVNVNSSMELVGVAVIEKTGVARGTDPINFDNVHEGDLLCILMDYDVKKKPRVLYRFFLVYHGEDGPKETTIRIDRSLALLESMRAHSIVNKHKNSYFSYHIEPVKKNV